MSLEGISHHGRFGVLAIDHRDSLRAVVAPNDPSSVSAESITGLKRELVGALAAGATGVMLEPEYSIPQLLDGTLPDGVGFTAALEAQGYAADPEAAVSQGCAGFMAGRALWGDSALAPPAERPSIIAEVVAPRLAELRRIVS